MANEKRLIDAVALKKAILAEPWKDQPNMVRLTVDYINIIVDEQPTVDAVEVVHGRWIDDGGLDEDGNGQYRCSCCGVGEKHNPTVPVSYCWNCGAIMDGERRTNEPEESV